MQKLMICYRKCLTDYDPPASDLDRDTTASTASDFDLPPPYPPDITPKPTFDKPKIPPKPVLNNFARPLTKIIDDKDHNIEITAKKPPIKKANLSEQLQDIFPDPDEAVSLSSGSEKFKTEVENLRKILSQIGDETPLEFEFFKGGKNEKFSEYIKSLAPSAENLEFLDFVQSDICLKILQDNKLKIHIETGDIYYDNKDTNKSIFDFFINQQNPTTGYIKHKFVYDQDYVGYFDWLVSGFTGYEQNKLDVFKFKNAKYLLYRYNDFLQEPKSQIKKVKHSTVTEVYRSWQYFIESVLELSKDQKSNQSIKKFQLETLENIAIAKKSYESFHNTVEQALIFPKTIF